MITLPVNADLRRPEYRREVFLRFYDFHTRYGTHPGLVYMLIPGLAERLRWTTEETLWFSFLNGCTQHPPSTLILHDIASTPADAHWIIKWLETNTGRLSVDTDRRYHRRAIPSAIAGYLKLLNGASATDFWTDTASRGWNAIWSATTATPTFGRLSAWSFCDYLLCSGINIEPDTLILEDKDGSRSHRNGLAIVSGNDHLDWHTSNPTFDGHYTPTDLETLADYGDSLLTEARLRAVGEPHLRHVNRLTLESALCTYKSFHRPNRRYPNVYADMLHDRLKASELAWPEASFDVFWEIRQTNLPKHLRLEATPGDPGCVPLKQNYYRETGRLPMMSHDYPDMANEFDDMVASGDLGRHR